MTRVDTVSEVLEGDSDGLRLGSHFLEENMGSINSISSLK